MQIRILLRRTVSAIAIGAFLSACSGAGEGSPPVNPHAGSQGLYGDDLVGSGASIIHRPGSRFWEYSLPAEVKPTSLANGPQGSIWFPACNGTSAVVYRMSASTGSITSFVPPSLYGASRCQIASGGGYVWYALQDSSEYFPDMGRVSAAGIFTFSDFRSTRLA